jgi:hypothetical protein
MSKVVFKTADGVRVMAADTVPGKESARLSWLVAIRHIILRVLPNPISSASRPPRKSAGASSVSYLPTLFV